MNKDTYLLPEVDMPVTAGLFRHVFGTDRYPAPTRPGYRIGAELVGFDLVRLFCAGGSRTPVLVLVGGANCGAKVFLQWLQRLFKCGSFNYQESTVVHAHDLSSLRDLAGRRCIIVLDQWPTAPMCHLVEIINNHSHIRETHPITGQEVLTEVHAHVIICTETLPAGPEIQTPLWVRHLKPVPFAAEAMLPNLQHELLQVMDLLARKPFMTALAGNHWFAPELIQPNA